MSKNYKLYIGCNVAGGKSWDRQEASNIIIAVCKARGIEALSLSNCTGIYTYNDGHDVTEASIILMLVDWAGDVAELAEALKIALKQECIMVEELASKFQFI